MITYEVERPALANVPAWSDKPVPVVVVGETRMKYVVRVLGKVHTVVKYVPQYQIQFLDSGE